MYCYSTNEEEYYGTYDTRDEALAEATADLEGQDEPGETRKVWTGVQKPAMHFLRKSTEHLGRDFAERIDEWLADNIAAEEEVVEVKDYAALGAALLDVLEKHATFNRWAVHEVQQHEAIVPGQVQADMNALLEYSKTQEFECLGEPSLCTNPRGCACVLDSKTPNVGGEAHAPRTEL